MAQLLSPNLGLPYPDETSAADTPFDVKALVDKLDALANFAAPGDLKASAANAVPAGWLLCDGSAVSRATYAALFNAIGVTYGAGDGSGTFNLPDYRGRTIVGAGAGAGLTARARGDKGGEEAHALSIGEMPSHNHGGATGTGQTPASATGGGGTGTESAPHNHNVRSVFNSACTTGPAGFLSVSGSEVSGTENQAHAHSVPALSIPALPVPALAIGAQGGGAGHNVMQPYAVANVLIKT